MVRLEVRDSMDQIIGAFDFEVDMYQERKIYVQSSSGGAVAMFNDSSPLIYVKVPTYDMTVAETEPITEEPADLEARQLPADTGTTVTNTNEVTESNSTTTEEPAFRVS